MFFPFQMQVKLIEYLIKFECSASQGPLNQKLVYHCFFSSIAATLENIGLIFISKELFYNTSLEHMIRFNDLTTDH